MRYAMLLWPHANARYREAIEPLAQQELLAVLTRAFPDIGPETFAASFESVCGARYLAFSMPEEREGAISLLRGHSAIALLFRIESDGLWSPICGPCESLLGEDLSGVLKYKGKTNERFTRFVLHMAFLSMECAPPGGQRLRFIDPLCGKGTSLFEAVNLGWDAYGSDIDSGDCNEGFAFYSKYLEYHRVKHQKKAFSMTVPPGKGAPVRSIQAAGTGEIRFAVCDVSETPYVFGKGKAHIVAADMPYGVQHAPGEAGRAWHGTLRSLAQRFFAASRDCLEVGGVAAVSLNTNTLPVKVARECAQEAGLTPLEGGVYEGLSHWVEQAVTRDVVIAVKRKKPQ